MFEIETSYKNRLDVQTYRNWPKLMRLKKVNRDRDELCFFFFFFFKEQTSFLRYMFKIYELIY